MPSHYGSMKPKGTKKKKVKKGGKKKWDIFLRYRANRKQKKPKKLSPQLKRKLKSD